MSTINGVGYSAGVNSNPGIVGGGLSPETLLLYCASQLNALDSEIQSRMAKQQSARDSQRGLNELKATLGTGEITGDKYAQKEKILAKMKEAYDKLPPGDPNRKTLDDLFNEFADTACTNDRHVFARSLSTYSGPDDPKLRELADTPDFDQKDQHMSNLVSTDELKKLNTDIDGMINDISKGAELEMINLQSLVSQRQMAVQLATGMLNKLNETALGVVNNVGK